MYVLSFLERCLCINERDNKFLLKSIKSYPPASKASRGVYGPFGSNPFLLMAHLKTCPNSHHSQWDLELLTTQTHTIRRGALRFATQISPLLNLNRYFYNFLSRSYHQSHISVISPQELSSNYNPLLTKL